MGFINHGGANRADGSSICLYARRPDLPFWDTQCGFKAFRMSVCRPLVECVQIERFGFDVELIYVAQLAGLRLSEIPVRWNNDAASKVSVIRDSFRMVDEVWRIRRAASQGDYDAADESRTSGGCRNPTVREGADSATTRFGTSLTVGFPPIVFYCVLCGYLDP